MNPNFLFKLSLAFGTITFASVSLFNKSIDAQAPYRKNLINFYCGEFTDESSGETIPATMAYVPQRKVSVSVIGWKTHIPDWDAQRRCETVSPQFQTFYEDGRLNYLTTGVNNSYDIICAVVEQRQPCKPEDQLFQVKASEDPQAVLKALTGIIEGTASKPIYQSSGDKIYVSMKELLDTAPAVDEADLTSN